MRFDSSRWDSLVVSDDEEESPQRTQPMQAHPAGRCQLLTVPWDSHCEMVRWALDRHGMPYKEFDLPWGLHLWETLGFSEALPKPQQTNVPVLINAKKEIFRTPTAILTYLYSMAFSGAIRIYSKLEALDLQEHFDGEFAAAAKTIFLHTMLSQHDLATTFIRDRIHLNYWRSLSQFMWPILSWALWKIHDLGSSDRIESAWAAIDAGFARAESELAKQASAAGSSLARINSNSAASIFLTCATISAADISFASHAALVLFPSDDDDAFPARLDLALPPIQRLPEHVRNRISRLRASPAGQFALRLYRKERGKSMGTKPSRFSRANNPAWASRRQLWMIVINTVLATAMAIVAPFALLPAPIAAGLWVLVIAVVYQFVLPLYKDTKIVQRLNQIWFIINSKSDASKTKKESVENSRSQSPESSEKKVL